MTCENCIHYDICNENADGNIVELMGEPCFRFFELVRCKNCDHMAFLANETAADMMCALTMICVDGNHFCSHGERGKG